MRGKKLDAIDKEIITRFMQGERFTEIGHNIGLDHKTQLIRRVNRIQECAVASTTVAACVQIALGSNTIEEAVARFMAKHGG